MEAPNQRDAADYETLRSEALLMGASQAGTLLPFGLVVWLTAVAPRRRLPSTAAQSAAASHSGFLPAAFASIVWRLTQEAAHA
jgi:hypothetical protein